MPWNGRNSKLSLLCSGWVGFWSVGGQGPLGCYSLCSQGSKGQLITSYVFQWAFALFVSCYFGLIKSFTQLLNGVGPHQVLVGKVRVHQFFFKCRRRPLTHVFFLFIKHMGKSCILLLVLFLTVKITCFIRAIILKNYIETSHWHL